MKAFADVEAPELFEKIEGLSVRFGVPHCPEYELAYFRCLRRPELLAALAREDAALARRDDASARARRGRLRRAAGDLVGALTDFQRALELEPGLAAAHAGLGEADLARPGAEQSLTRALELDAGFAWAWMWRGAARLLRGDAPGAKTDFQWFLRLAPDSGLGFLLLGVAEERLRSRSRALKAYARAWEKNPVCSAACLLASRAAPDFAAELFWFQRAYDVGPVLGFITLQIHQTLEVDARPYVRKIRRLCFDEPEKVGAYYRREATQAHSSHFPADDYAFVRKLHDEHPERPWVSAFFGRAACYTRSGVPEGIEHLTRAIELCPQAGWARAWRANARRAGGDLTGALEDFDEATRLQPYYHRAFVWRGALLRKLGRWDEALADLDRGLAMDERYGLAYHERGLTRRGLGDIVGGAFDLDRAYRIDQRYGWVFKTGGAPTPQEIAKGVADLTGALKRFSSVPSLWTWRGQLKVEQGELSAAILDFERACELDPHHAIAHCWAARAFLESGLPETAAARAERALALEPGLGIARRWLAESLRALGRKAEARRALAAALAQRAASPWAHYLLARYAFDDGRPALAEKKLDRALLLDGKYPDAYLLLAQVRLARGDAAGSLRAARRCVDVAPNLGRAYAARAAASAALGLSSEALSDYRKILAEFPYLLNDAQRSQVEALLAAKA